MRQYVFMLGCTTAIATSLLLPGCAQTEQTVESSGSSQSREVSQDQLRGHIEFLAADSLKGRDTGSEGYQVAADYVAAEFTKLGLKPAGDAGTYFQEVPLVETRLVKGSGKVTLHTSEGNLELQYPQQFIMGPDPVESSQTLRAGLVFVGYGIVAEEYAHDDYAGLDVTGKIVVMLAGRPQSWPTEEGAHLGSGREKARYAAEAGAVGRIVLHTPRGEKVFPYEENFPYLDVPRMNWLDGNGRPDAHWPQLRGGAQLNLDAAAKLFVDSPTPLQDIYAADTEGKPIRGFALPGAATLARQSSHRKLSSPNVAAVLEGSDPKLRAEYLVYSGHLDHIGVITGEAGADDIYNGAMDNAAGIATLLESARVLRQYPLKRSVLFLAVTGEEKGLLGAGYYASNPTVPGHSMVANINLDMPVLVFPFADVIAFGADHSNLKSSVEKAARLAGIALAPDPMPEQAIFVRSDHYRFVQQGIPAVYLATGFTSKNSGEDGKQLWHQFKKAHYHQPSDQADLPIDYESAAIFTEININIGREICNREERPAWNTGDFFGRTFSQHTQ